LQFLLWLVGRIARKQGTDATAGDVPAPLAVPLLVFSSGDEGRAWRRVSADVELIDLPRSRDDSVASHAAAVTSYLRARLQSIGDSGSKNETTRGVL
jgi:hypothetical protein